MKISIIPGRELSDSLVGNWRRLQQSNADLASPYFHPEFTRVVARARPDVEVAVVEADGKITAFFPFQREDGAIGRPVGGILSDYHGIICAPGFGCDARELVRRCRLKAWDFDHLLASQSFFAEFHHSTDLSPQLDLSQGFDAYNRSVKWIQSEQRKARHIQTDLGPLRFVSHSADRQHLDQVVAWKSQQYAKTKVANPFINSWFNEIVSEIHRTEHAEFSGVLSLLYAGDCLVAGHIGIRAGPILHSWFPTYDLQMSRYSPGLLLFMKMAEHAPAAGIRIIDLGQGMSTHKQRMMNSSCRLASGSVELASLRYMKRAVRRQLKSVVLRSWPGLAKALRRARSGS
jgi:CelD/BcsL family acetyltransferase involved in cellulose biosynthesis